MLSKFWAESSGSSESENEVSEEEYVEPKNAIATAAWAAESSSSEDEGRVVKTLRDRRWEAMRNAAQRLSNHIKIRDFSEVIKDYETLIVQTNKSSMVMYDEGVPKFLIRVFLELEEFIDDNLKNKETFSKLTKGKATILNTLKAKFRKQVSVYAPLIDNCRKNPAQFESSDEEDDEFDEEDLDIDVSDEELEHTEKIDDTLEEEDEWESTKELSQETPELKSWEEAEQPQKFKLEVASKSRTKKIKLQKKEKEQDKSSESFSSLKDLENDFDTKDLNADKIRGYVQMIVERRGRRGVDRMEQTKVLRRLADMAKSVGPQCHLEVVGLLVTAEFDMTAGVFTCLNCLTWLETYRNLESILQILENHKNCYLIPTSQERESISEINVKEMRKTSHSVLTSFMERLDDELTKSLQFTDVHCDDYKERLGQSINLVALLWSTYVYFVNQEDFVHASSIALKILEHVHYKSDSLSIHVWELVKSRVRECKRDDRLNFENQTPTDLLDTLVQLVFQYGSQRERTRALLHLAYNRSLHDKYHEARDLLLTPNVHEMAMQTDVHTQILYNRNLVQLGFCAFRKGQFREAHTCLSEICAQSKHRELLAQGLLSSKSYDKTPEQERAEKRRLLPYHMHISLELIDAVHNICAMLVEVPDMAQNPLANRHPISRHFHRIIEYYEKQAFTGPPENARETIMAATTNLQKGDWEMCCKHIFSMHMWDKISEKEKVQEILKQKIKQEAMRTYVFTYLMIYDSFSVKQLSEIFDLPSNTVHSIISKMMVNEEIVASWDQTSRYIIINRVETSRLQRIALNLADSLCTAVEHNELTLNMKNPKFIMAFDRRFQREPADRLFWGNKHDDNRLGKGHRSNLYHHSKNRGGDHRHHDSKLFNKRNWTHHNTTENRV